MRRLHRLRPRIEAIVDSQLDAIEAAGQPADLVDLFAMPIPSLVICELLGVPYADREGFQALSTARFDLGDDSPLDVIGTSLDYLQGLVVARAGQPGRRPARHADPRTRRRHQRPGAGRAGRRPADRRARDDGQFARPRCARADAEPGLLRPAGRRRRRHRAPGGRGAAALPDGGAGRVSAVLPDRGRDRRPADPGRRAGAGLAVRRGSGRGAAGRGHATDMERSIRPGRRRRTWRSGTASTAASAPNWPGSSCGSPFPALARRFPTMRPAVRWTNSSSAIPRSSTARRRCRSSGSAIVRMPVPDPTRLYGGAESW